MVKKKLIASLIGINAYNQSPLDGCIKDILNFDLFLRDFTSQQTTEPIEYLPEFFLSPDDSVDLDYIKDHEIATGQSLAYKPATFKNVSTLAFDHLKNTKKGDICVFYFSGHGSQTEAPDVFWHTKPDRQNETIVCIDSRDPNNHEARDLIDKELGYLLWDSLKGKDVHCLVIMDCCHSGNNTRALSNTVKFRHMGSARNKVPLESYIGYNKDSPFYTVKDGKVDIEVANYVHLAAALDFEKAQDGLDGGLFTRKLIELLRAGGTQKSYRELMRSAAISVNNRASQQTPVAFANNDNDLDLPFLGSKTIPYRPVFSVRYDLNDEVWKLYGGALHGIVPKSKITIIGPDKKVTIIEVLSTTSILDKEETKSLEQGKEYEGLIQETPFPRFTVGISESLEKNKTKLEALKTEYNSKRPSYFVVNFDSTISAEYLVRLTIDGEYILTSTANDVPLFKRQAGADRLLTGIDAIGKWRGALELQNSATGFSRKDFDIIIEKVEGVKLGTDRLNDLSINTTPAESTEELTLRYVNDHQPGLRISIKINNESNVEECFVGCLFLSSDFGIYESFIDKGSKLNKKQALEVKFGYSGKRYLTIPLKIEKGLTEYNIDEIDDYLKLIVSEKPLDLTSYKQAPLELDNPTKGRTRSLGPEESQDSDWAVFTTKIRVIGKKKEVQLEPETTSNFADFEIKVPKGVSAKAVAVTGNDLQTKLSKLNLRTRDSEASQAVQMIIPRDDMWGDALTEDVAFPQGLNTPSNNNLSALEILPNTPEGTIKLPPGEELIIIPKKTNLTRSIDDSDIEDTIIPYAFDIENELWYPVGYQDEAGAIHIGTLPKPTPGTLSNPQEELTRSLCGSIKLFFKKIFRKKGPLNTLVLYKFKEDGSWEELTRDLEKMNSLLKTKPNGRALLMTHGFTGDTKHIVESLKESTEFPATVDFVFTYDYENLATPINKAAESLHKDLTKIGFGSVGIPTLTILAHSQGGLLARWLVEKTGGDKYIRSVILVGVASAGTDFATLGASALTLITHALNGPPPIKFVITGLSFLLKKLELDPGRTLKDTKPDSDFIKELKLSSASPSVQYMVIGGDTTLLKDYNGDDGFLKKLGKALVRNVAFPTLTHTLFKGKANDMVVSLESMQGINGLTVGQNVRIVASDHLAYFREKLIQNELIEFIKI